MLGSENIVRLYNRVLDNDMLQYNIPEWAVKNGIKSMTEVYKPRKDREQAVRSTVADFNDAAHRCAYLHKYASLHTAMVRDLMFSAIRQNYNFFCDLLFAESTFKICSLGGGPGSDVVGVMASLMETFIYRHDLDFNISIVDYMTEWSRTFNSIMMELESGAYGPFGPSAGQTIQWRYLGANLLKSLDPEVEGVISSASLVTMIKFVSAANCKDTESMIKNIFSAMKPGAVLFFVDNDGGGFREIITKYAYKFNFIPIVGPLKHENYSNPIVKTLRFGSTSCHKTTVSLTMLQKPHENINPFVSLSPGSRCSRTVNYSFAAGNTPLTPSLRTPSTPLTPFVYNHQDAVSETHNQPTSSLVPSPLYKQPINGLLPDPLYNQPINGLLPDPLYNQPINGLLPDPLYNQPINGFLPDPLYIQPMNSFFPNPMFYQAPNSLLPTNAELYSGYRHSVYTPETPRLGHSRVSYKNGCLPLPKFGHWRHHLSSKLDALKSRFRNRFEKKISKKPNKKNDKDSK